MTTVEEYTARHAPAVLVKYIKNHTLELDWLENLCDLNTIPFELIGYEHRYRNNLEEYFKIRNSKDYWTRLRPDVKIFLNGKYYLVDVKYKPNWLPAYALFLNTFREYPVIYILARKHYAFATEIFQNQARFLEQMLIFTKKAEPQEHVDNLKSYFKKIPFRETDNDIGKVWDENINDWKYVSGDTCLRTRNDAPFSQFNSLIPQ